MKAALAPLLGVVASAGRISLDCEQARDDAYAFESDAIASARGFDQASSRMGPAPWALAARALEEGQDARAVALHGAREVRAEEAFHTLGVADGRIEEGHPSGVGPGPHRAVADPFGRIGVEHGDAGGVGTEQAWGSRLILDEPGDGGEQVDRGGDAPAERLRRHVDPGASEASALPLDGLMLDVLVAHSLDDQRVGELAALDDLRRRRRGNDRVVVGASDGLVEALFNEHVRRDHVENQAARVTDGGHHRAALRADAQLRGHAIEHGHARQVCGRRAPPGVAPATLRPLGVGRRVVHGLRGGGHEQALDR